MAAIGANSLVDVESLLCQVEDDRVERIGRVIERAENDCPGTWDELMGGSFVGRNDFPSILESWIPHNSVGLEA
ncbi:hypothetical protein [Rhodococcus jostii]|uniref:hypothetical protein n=1 Tax=Rhodococcus jostii TaxID=132919 RepID=UPI003634C520